VELELAGQPELQADLLEDLAQMYRDLGHPTEAQALRDRSAALRQGLGEGEKRGRP
jgi:hypothetical protein